MAVLHLRGTGASPGLGLGRAYIYRKTGAADLVGRPADRPTVMPGGDRQAEVERLRRACLQAAEELERLSREVSDRIGPAEAAVFEAQALFLDDPSVIGPMERAILEQGHSAAAAARKAIDESARELASLEDPYLMARATDLRDIGDRLLRHLDAPAEGAATPADSAAILRSLAPQTVLIADDLTPSDTIGLDHETIAGIVLAGSTPLAHAAILARGLGLPLVVAAGESVWHIRSGQPVLLDGTAGAVLVEPDPQESADYQVQLTRRRRRDAEDADREFMPVHTADGHRVELAANVSTPAEARLALSGGAEAVGLLRTEFVLTALAATLTPGIAPDEHALADAYGAIFATMGDRPVIVRTMDVGGDKPLPFLDMGQEANPFLGWRGIRVHLDEPQLFASQVRAVLCAAAKHRTDLRLMFPMVSTVDEFLRARQAVEEIHRASNNDLTHPLQIGVMIEVPAAALIADGLAREADFFSIGTNDLIQYTLAADRGNARVRSLCRLTHPAVLRLIDMTVRAAHDAGKPVGVCGEAAGALPDLLLLVGLGVDELSVGAARLPEVRDALVALDYQELRALATAALAQSTAEHVEKLLEQVN